MVFHLNVQEQILEVHLGVVVQMFFQIFVKDVFVDVILLLFPYNRLNKLLCFSNLLYSEFKLALFLRKSLHRVIVAVLFELVVYWILYDR